MSDDRLFAVEQIPEPEKLSADRARTLRHKTLIANGTHPATLLAIDPNPDHTCGGCVHLERMHWHNGSYLKCPKHRLGKSHGAASDVRASWPACHQFKEPA